jgi:hypothetical protein
MIENLVALFEEDHPISATATTTTKSSSSVSSKTTTRSKLGQKIHINDKARIIALFESFETENM